MRVWNHWKYRLLELVFLIICPTLLSEPGKILAGYMQKISILSAFNIYLQQAITVIFPTFSVNNCLMEILFASPSMSSHFFRRSACPELRV